jgi:hypothetical protein
MLSVGFEPAIMQPQTYISDCMAKKYITFKLSWAVFDFNGNFQNELTM